jgi:predicted DCC family thiol-disulfide oxidoreductase YuxK
MDQDVPIVLFDGVCNFCNYWVNFAIKRDKKNKLKFSPIQGETAKQILPGYSVNPRSLSSVIFIVNGKVHTQSSAALQIARHLNGGWKLFYGLIIIPKFIRDFFYNIIARNRYRWFGKKESCVIPTWEMRERFLP